MEPPGPFALGAGDWHLVIDAARGGQILQCTWRGHEVLAPALPGLWPSDSDAGCFPLVPYSNRIRDASLPFAERRIALPAPAFVMPHALHGLGWRSAWTPAPGGPDETALVHTHDGRDWPWPYRARQRFAARGNRLAITCEIENTGGAAMPAGLGLHPYFPRRPDLQLSVRAGGFWTTLPDNPGLPQDWRPLDPDTDFFAGKDLRSQDLDTCFTGWSRKAQLTYPGTGLSITLTASAAFPNLVIYCPKDRNVLCLEPVSHVNDAANLAGLNADQAMNILAPGEQLTGEVILETALAPD